MSSTAVNDLTGKVALITVSSSWETADKIFALGASSGIGAATAIHFSRLGASLALTGRNEDNLSKTGEECERNGEKPLLIVGDLTIEEDVKRIFDETVKHFGKLNILVNNAGVGEFGTIETTSMEQYDRVFNINVRPVYQMTMLCTPHLVETKGAIVNVSSVNGIRAFPNLLTYNMAKAAVDHMTRCVALELAPKGVRCNSVNPGVIITEIHKRAGLNDEQYAAFLEHSKVTHALGRPGNAEEVAKSIAFLASEDSSFITGASLPVDGGRHAMCPR